MQKWPTADVVNVNIEKSKHVLITFGGASPVELQFNAGSAGAAQEILIKIEASRSASTPAPAPAPAAAPAPSPIRVASPPADEAASKPSVHFATTPPQMIPPREPSEAGSYEEPGAATEADGESAVVLYDFSADGEDELSVREGEHLLVIEKDSDEWWKCRNSSGAEGVVPAQYLEVRPSCVRSAVVALTTTLSCSWRLESPT